MAKQAVGELAGDAYSLVLGGVGGAGAGAVNHNVSGHTAALSVVVGDHKSRVAGGAGAVGGTVVAKLDTTSNASVCTTAGCV